MEHTSASTSGYAAKSYKRKLHVTVDIETLSTSKRAAIIHIGAVVAYGGDARVANEFEVKIKPMQYPLELEQFVVDKETMEWHNKTNPGYVSSCETDGVHLQTALNVFCDWIRGLGTECEIHFWSQGKDFDFPILEYALEQCGIKAPWAYSRIHCLRDLVWLNPVARIRASSETDGPAHTALADARFEAKQLRAVIANSTWYQRLFA